MVAVLHVNFEKRTKTSEPVAMFNDCSDYADKVRLLAGKMVEETAYYRGSVPKHVMDENTTLMEHLSIVHADELDDGIESVREIVSDVMLFLEEDESFMEPHHEEKLVEQIKSRPTLYVVK